MTRLLPRSLTGRLMLVLNGALVVLVAAFSSWDLRALVQERVTAKRNALDDEAEAIAYTAQQMAREQRPNLRVAVQSYIDIVCRSTQEDVSPGHYILVQVGDEEIETTVHLHWQLNRAERDALAAAGRTRQVGRIRGRRAVVGRGTTNSAPPVTVYVSEYLSDIRRAMDAELRRRVAGVIILTLGLALVANVALQRLVRRPLRRLAGTMRQVARGQVGAQAALPRVSELRDLTAEFNRMTSALEQAESDRLKRLERARRIQQKLLPRLGRVGRYQLEGFHLPADAVAGDFWDVIEAPDGSVLVCLADVSGHGVPGAMGATMLKVLVADAAALSTDPAEILARVNVRYAELSIEDDFATMVLVRLQPVEETITYASAGHEAAILIRPPPAEPDLLESTGPPIGIEPRLVWTAGTRTFGPHDRLVLATDGVVETTNAGREPFGRPRLLQLVREFRGRPVGEAVAAVQAALVAHLGGNAPADDTTLVGIERITS